MSTIEAPFATSSRYRPPSGPRLSDYHRRPREANSAAAAIVDDGGGLSDKYPVLQMFPMDFDE